MNELARYGRQHPEPPRDSDAAPDPEPTRGPEPREPQPRVPESPAAGTTPEVVVLLSRAADRTGRVRALRAAGYQVTVAREPWAAAFAHRAPVLVTDDPDVAGRVRAELVATMPRSGCVALIDEPTPPGYRRLLGAGCTVLPVSCADDDLTLAVAAAARALVCVPVAIARSFAGSDGDQPLITSREASWMRALVAGTTVASLARGAGYSQREMYRVLGHLYARLGAGNRTEALLLADRWGLLTPADPAEAPRRPRVPNQRARP